MDIKLHGQSIIGSFEVPWPYNESTSTGVSFEHCGSKTVFNLLWNLSNDESRDHSILTGDQGLNPSSSLRYVPVVLFQATALEVVAPVVSGLVHSRNLHEVEMSFFSIAPGCH